MLHFFGLAFSLMLIGCSMQNKRKDIEWLSSESLPSVENKAHIGLAGALIGRIDNKLIVAGGANFPSGKPWEGGKKHYQKELFIYEIRDNKLFLESSQIFEDSLAYSANVSYNHSLISVGGERNGNAIQEVYMYEWKENKLVRKNLPNLPIPLTNSSAVIFHENLYVIGGENAEFVSNKILKLNLKTLKNWEEAASLPYAISHAVAASDFNGNIFIAGGRKRNPNAKSDMYNNIFKLNTNDNVLSLFAEMPYALAAGTGCIFENELIIVGGDDASTFHKVEDYIGKINLEKNEDEKVKLIEAKNNLQSQHPGFSKSVLALDLTSKEWRNLKNIEGESPVTTTLVLKDNLLIIPSGEIKAGVRTPQILLGTLK